MFESFYLMALPSCNEDSPVSPPGDCADSPRAILCEAAGVQYVPNSPSVLSFTVEVLGIGSLRITANTV